MGRKIYYLVADYDVPSWGIGLLYHHVRLLREAGFEAFVLHERAPFRLSWLDLEAPIRYRDDPAFRPTPSDVLVVPEVLASSARELPYPCRRVVFVQGTFLILSEVDAAFDYRELGYEAALAVLPHSKQIVATHFGLEPMLVPPFIAPYFFSDEESLDRGRQLKVLLVGKPEYLQAGYLDREIVEKLLARHFERLAESRGGDKWETEVLAGLGHRETARLMQQAQFLVNLNTLEAFNTTVPEAMAAGCVTFCYEAFGGRDFLRAGENAFVFPNNHAYPLVEKIIEMTADFPNRGAELATMRRRALRTAGRYREEATARALREFFGSFLR